MDRIPFIRDGGEDMVYVPRTDADHQLVKTFSLWKDLAEKSFKESEAKLEQMVKDGYRSDDPFYTRECDTHQQNVGMRRAINTVLDLFGLNFKTPITPRNQGNVDPRKGS
jgi:hypothetical protein